MTGRSKGGYRPGDSDLWDRVAKTVTHRNPRRGDHIDRMDFDDPGPSNTDQKAEKSKNIEPASIIAATPPRRNSEPRVLPDLVHGKQPNFDKRTETKLKRGLMPIEGRLDLHGMTQNQARSALGDFITHAYHARKRCVLVITGKGLGRSDGSAGIASLHDAPLSTNPVSGKKSLAFATPLADTEARGALCFIETRAKGFASKLMTPFGERLRELRARKRPEAKGHGEETWAVGGLSFRA